MNLLIVDRDRVIGKRLQSIVQNKETPRWTVCTAMNKEEALSHLMKFQTDIIVSVDQMPGYNAFELLAEARDHGICEHYIIMSEHHHPFTMRQAIRFKVTDYLFKPINVDELSSQLCELADKIEKEKTSSEAMPHPTPLGKANKQEGGHSINIKKIVQFIDRHYTDDISLDQISDYVDLHPNYISALFKKEVGMNFIPYLRSKRINRAKELMATYPHASLDQISEMAGFENTRHFFNVFKKICGMTPGKYREQYVRNKRTNS